MRFLLGLSAMLLCVATAHAEIIAGYAPHSGVTLRDTSEKALPPGPATVTVTHSGIAFSIWYEDVRLDNNIGFDGANGADARARFEDALAYAASVLNETGALDVVVGASQTDGTGFLASAGTYFPLAAGFHPGATLARLSSGTKPFGPSTEEIFVVVDFGHPWYFGTANPPFTSYDFRSVMLHEVTHGLGFASLSNASGASNISPGCHTVYDSLMRRRTGNTAIFTGVSPVFSGTVADLISGDLAWGGAAATAAYQPNPAPGLYAPNPFQSGSSLSHWNTGAIVGGAVMEHAITNGEVQREYAPIDIGALRDIGYSNASDPDAVQDCTLENDECPPFVAMGTALVAQLVGLTLLPNGTTYANINIDLPVGGPILDRYEVALAQAILCGSGDLNEAARCAFAANLELLTTETGYPLIAAADDFVAVLLTISSELQLALGGIALTNSYTVLGAGAKDLSEPLSPGGDPDGDGLTNAEEYANVIADGGDEADYVAAALNPLLDGSAASASALPVGGIAAAGALMLALGAASAALLRRRK